MFPARRRIGAMLSWIVPPPAFRFATSGCPAFASTEAGVGFEVRDGRAGFPASMSAERGSHAEIKVTNGSLHLRSDAAASRFLGDARPVAAADGFVDTEDMVELRDDRYVFVGRRSGIINVGGLKVHPEEVEAFINQQKGVRVALVRARKNPITGSVVVADVVADREAGPDLAEDILQACRRVLPRHKVPTAIRLVATLGVSTTGKLGRRHA
jgi:acyl-coenzyme A synthetase/AMP-(fatty) acid ligase